MMKNNGLLRCIGISLCVCLCILTACQREPAVRAAALEAANDERQQISAEVVWEHKTGQTADSKWELPSKWDNRLIGRTASIKNQGDLGTCWAFAALGGLETLWLPQEIESFSVDHMTMNHGFSAAVEEGGNFTMALAYLAGWRGPVWEADDPYADGMTNSDAPVRGHLQEAQLLKDDRYAIKEAVLRNGSVQSSLYVDEALLYQGQSTEYYREDRFAYYYDGEVQYNHDVLIIGWDDAYSRENFAKEPAGDGAFICQNSWGESFGDNGFFYVSYYDTAVAQNTLTYSRLDKPGVYDRIYQHDELGWTGQMGYEDETAWGANVFTAKEQEQLAAVSFYTTEDFTDYQIYVDTEVELDGFRHRRLAAEGVKRHAGYYTVDLEQPVALEAGESFAILICITTPGAEMPLAAEYYQPGSKGGNVKIGAGESYISKDGVIWQDAGTELQCNLCLKAFTKKN